ncbi:MAG: hypothetical protein GY925_27460 [Actinomycetia bacterium]|nr:hypothetical protein [Actinomycetes bacterium]
MSALTQLEQIRHTIAAEPDAIAVARTRLTDALAAAKTFPGALRTFRSGSLATKFVNDPVEDGDGGVVMDRRSQPGLGPEGRGELPQHLVEALRRHLRPLLVSQYPSLRIDIMKRGLLLHFGAPLASGEDPTVDLVVALNRIEDDALWIPNLDRNRWDPSHPVKHVTLFTSGWDSLRLSRQYVVRVAKAQVKQFSSPAVCSFNIAALAWECTITAEPLDHSLYRFYDYAATELAQGLTEDPAGISEPIRVVDRQLAVDRFRRTADAIGLAIDAAGDDEKVAELLAAFGVFWKLLPQLEGSSTSAIHQAIATAGPLSVGEAGSLVTGRHASAPLVKPTRSYGARP